MYCARCGSKLKEDARYCIVCGKKIDDESGDSVYSYQKNTCKFLREVRRTIAEMNDIYTIDFSECNHKEMCLGTCPKCENEISELDKELKLKIIRGERVFLPDVTVDSKEIIPLTPKIEEQPTDQGDWGETEPLNPETEPSFHDLWPGGAAPAPEWWYDGMGMWSIESEWPNADDKRKKKKYPWSK